MGRRVVALIDDVWDRISPLLGRRLIVREALLAATIVLYLAINTARTALDHGIAKIHDNGVSGISTNSLHNGPKAITTAFATWRAGYARLRPLLGHHPVRLAEAQTALELLLVPLSFLVWYAIGRAIRRQVAGGGHDAVRRPIQVVLIAAALGVLGHALLGLFDQLAELAILVHGRNIRGVGSLLHVTGVVRSLLLPLFVVPMLVGLLQIRRDRLADPDPDRPRLWQGTTTTYRVLIVVAALHAVLVLVSIPGQQTQDALRLWLATPRLAIVGLLFTAVLSTALAAIALRLGTDARPRRVVLARRGTLRMLAIGLALVLVGALARYGTGPLDPQAWGTGMLAAGLLTTLTAALSLPLAPKEAGAPEPTTTSSTAPLAEPADSARRLVPALLAMAPLTALTLVLVRASVPSVMDSQSSGWLFGYAALAGALAVLAFCLARACGRWAFGAAREPRLRAFMVALISLFVVTAVVYALVVADPWRWGTDVGVVGLITAFLTALVLVFGTLGYLMESRALPASLDFVGLRRLPVVLSLVAWALVSHSVAPRGYHDLLTLGPATLPAQPQITVTTAFDRWVAANLPSAQATDTPAASRPATPMVFVAAAGGGIKAAAFTAATLDCIFQGAAEVAPEHPCATTDSFDRLFAASGASGGSVGIASMLAERAGGEVRPGWVAARLGRDLLSPELGWQLFVEVPNAIVDFDPGLERGEVLQESWRRQYAADGTDPGDAPFYVDTSGSSWTGPLAYFSGTNLNDGCRVNISTVRSAQPGAGGQTPLDPEATRDGACNQQRVVNDGPAPDQAGTRDLTDYLCARNISLATAAFLSARFPVVSPTGTIRCEDHDPRTSDSLSIGDGGYRDNSGASSLMDAWAALGPLVAQYNSSHDQCVVPIFVEINNGYSGFGAPGTSPDVAQLVAPVLGASKVFSDLSYGEIEQAAAEFSRPLAPGLRVVRGGNDLRTRFYRITLVDHPGVTAPLGWSLSAAAVRDLVDQLGLAENREALQGLRGLLDPSGSTPLTCAT